MRAPDYVRRGCMADPKPGNPYSRENYVPAGADSSAAPKVSEDLELEWEDDGSGGLKCPMIEVKPAGVRFAVPTVPAVAPHPVPLGTQQQVLRHHRRQSSFRRRNAPVGHVSKRPSDIGFDALALQGSLLTPPPPSLGEEEGGPFVAASGRARAWSDEWWESGGGASQQPDGFSALRRRMSAWATVWPDEFADFEAQPGGADSTALAAAHFKGSGRNIELEPGAGAEPGAAGAVANGGADDGGGAAGGGSDAGALLQQVREALQSGALGVAQVHAVADEFLSSSLAAKDRRIAELEAKLLQQ